MKDIARLWHDWKNIQAPFSLVGDSGRSSQAGLPSSCGCIAREELLLAPEPTDFKKVSKGKPCSVLYLRKGNIWKCTLSPSPWGRLVSTYHKTNSSVKSLLILGDLEMVLLQVFMFKWPKCTSYMQQLQPHPSKVHPFTYLQKRYLKVLCHAKFSFQVNNFIF